MYKVDLALNKLQWLICKKTKQNQANKKRPNQTKLFYQNLRKNKWVHTFHKGISALRNAYSNL